LNGWNKEVIKNFLKKYR